MSYESRFPPPSWTEIAKKLDRDARIAEAATKLVLAMDHVVGPSWRADTLGAHPNNGDEVNWAWDELVAAIEGDEQ